jgi:hypothetical protein
MGNYNELPVYKATYDRLLGMFQFTKDFSKEYKYTVNERMKEQNEDMKRNRATKTRQTGSTDRQQPKCAAAGIARPRPSANARP